MKLNSVFAAALVAAGLVVAYPAPDAAGRPSQPLTLRGTNVFTANGPGAIDVIVPPGAYVDTREQVFSPSGPNLTLRFTGEGPFVGAVLQQQADAGFRFVAGRWDSCADRCDGKETFSYTEPSEGDTNLMTGERIGRFVKIPPGHYRIYLISGGGPITARIALRGLEGEARARAVDPTAIDVQVLPARLDVTAPDRLWSAGSTFDSGDEGFFISNMFIKAPELEDLKFGVCAPNGPGAPPEQVSYGPQCTALSYATGSGFFGVVDKPTWGERDYYLIQFSSFYNERAFPPNLTGQRGLGMWFSSPSEIEGAGAQAVFISLD